MSRRPTHFKLSRFSMLTINMYDDSLHLSIHNIYITYKVNCSL